MGDLVNIMLTAISTGQCDIFDKLLDDGYNVNSKDKYGTTALIKACSLSYKPWARYIIETLLTHGADTTIMLSDNTPLHWAAGFSNDENIIGILYNWGADFTSLTQSGNTPLMIAVLSHQHIKVINGIASLTPPFLVNHQNKKGNTVLHLLSKGWGTSAKTSDIWNILVAYGANTQIVNKKGFVPLDLF